MLNAHENVQGRSRSVVPCRQRMALTSSGQQSLTHTVSRLVVAKTIAFAFTVALPLLLVRRMAVEEFGLYKQIFLVINSAVTMLPLGFGLTAFYFLPREEQYRRHTVFHVVLITSATATLFAALLALAPSLLIVLFREPAAVQYAPWIGAIVVLWVVGAFLEIVTVANHDIGIATTAILAIQLSRATCFLVATLIAGTVRALVIAATVQGVVQAGALLIYLTRRFPGFWRAFDWAFLRRQLAYSLPFGIAGLLYSLQTDLHSYFVSHRFGAATYAVYAIGCFQLPLFGILAESVGSVMIPRISLLQHQHQMREILLLTSRAMRKLAAVYFPAYAFLLVMRREFIVGLFTDRYAASIPVFAINLTLIPLGVLLIDPIMRAYAEHRLFLVRLYAAILASLLVLLPPAIDRYGLVGAISIVVICQALGRAAIVLKVIRILEMKRVDLALFADVGRFAVAAAAAAMLTAIVRPLLAGPALLVLAGCAVCYGAAYVAASIAFKAVTRDERLTVWGLLWRAGQPSKQPVSAQSTSS
jgi:O-antigen/teichoic acid export membrane protein